MGEPGFNPRGLCVQNHLSDCCRNIQSPEKTFEDNTLVSVLQKRKQKCREVKKSIKYELTKILPTPLTGKKDKCQRGSTFKLWPHLASEWSIFLQTRYYSRRHYPSSPTKQSHLKRQKVLSQQFATHHNTSFPRFVSVSHWELPLAFLRHEFMNCNYTSESSRAHAVYTLDLNFFLLCLMIFLKLNIFFLFFCQPIWTKRMSCRVPIKHIQDLFCFISLMFNHLGLWSLLIKCLLEFQSDYIWYILAGN